MTRQSDVEAVARAIQPYAFSDTSPYAGPVQDYWSRQRSVALEHARLAIAADPGRRRMREALEDIRSGNLSAAIADDDWIAIASALQTIAARALAEEEQT